MHSVYLLDGMSLVFRAYHAMLKSGLKNANDELTGAVFGFANILTALLDREKPNRIGVIFDTPEPTFRHIKYPEYKANRAEFPEDLGPQIDKIKLMLRLMGIPQIELHGWEADDIIGTLAKQASIEKFKVFCVTSDKDYYQLVDDQISILKPAHRGDDIELVSYDGVEKKFGVKPNQVIDVMALIGDAVDNVPGVKGIGDKTAIPLIQKFGSLESLYDNLDKVESNTVRTKLETFKENAFLSKYLVTIDVTSPIPESLDHLIPNPINSQALDDFFKNNNFRQLRQKWAARNPGFIPESFKLDNDNKEASAVLVPGTVGSLEFNELKTISDSPHNYQLVDNYEELDKLVEILKNSKLISFDLETDSLQRDSTEIVGIALSVKENEAYYIPTEYTISSFHTTENLFSEEQKSNSSNFKYLNIEKVLEKLKPILTNPSIGKCGQNCKFDTYILNRHDIFVRPIVFDSMLASYIINPDTKHNLDFLSEKWLDYTPVSITSLIGEKKSTQISMREVDPKIISEYAGEDADLALKLKNKLEPELIKTGQIKLANEIEFPIVEVLTRMEANGVVIDTSALKELSIYITDEAAKMKEKIFQESSCEFNLDSPKQLAEILFEKMMIPPTKKTKTGYSTDVEVLNELAASYPIAQMIVDYRQLTKLKSTYIDALPKLINKETGRIHTTYNQTIASTGRLSSVEPNLQNIPIRSELGKQIRKAFIAGRSNNVILSADYSQIELRIMAHICDDDTLTEAFANGLDIHAATAAKLYKISLEEVNSDMRRVAKTVNFGIMYGLGSFGLAQRLKISRTEGRDIIDNYFASYPGIKKYMELTISDASTKGYAETISGRRRYFPELTSSNRNLRNGAERAAINMPIQGTASDMMKIAMINIHNELEKRKYGTLMMLQVHDELVFEVPENEITEVTQMVKEQMEKALPLGKVPVLVETGSGNNWFEAH